jgi:transcription initiation factor IIE alpha subunit
MKRCHLKRIEKLENALRVNSPRVFLVIPEEGETLEQAEARTLNGTIPCKSDLVIRFNFVKAKDGRPADAD